MLKAYYPQRQKVWEELHLEYIGHGMFGEFSPGVLG